MSRIQKKKYYEKRYLPPPWKRVSYYFDQIKQCRNSHHSQFIRHNYFILTRSERSLVLKCKHCESATLTNDNIDWLHPHERIKQKFDEKKKEIGDITVYRILIKKVEMRNGIIKWTSFPGINYIGIAGERLSGKTAKDRFKEHIINAFTNNRKKQVFEQFIADLFKTKKNFLKNYFVGNIELQIMKVIKFQGDWRVIRNIQDCPKRKQILEDAVKKTENLAGHYEKILIGFYHSQFDEFGKNIHEGGRFEEGIGLAYDPVEIDELFRQGYRPYGIVRKLGIRGNLADAAKLVRRYIKRYNYPDIYYPEGLKQVSINFRRGRELIFKIIFDNLINKGHRDYLSMLDALPGLESILRSGNEEGFRRTKRLKDLFYASMGSTLKDYINMKYQYLNYHKNAIELIKENGWKYSDKQLCLDLQYHIRYGYSLSNLDKNANRYLKEHIGKSIEELRKEAFKPESKEFYLRKAVDFIKIKLENNKRFNAGDLGLYLGFLELGHTETSIRKNAANRLIPKYIGLSYKDLISYVKIYKLS